MNNQNTYETQTAEYYDNSAGLIYESIPNNMDFLQDKSIIEKYALLKGKTRLGFDFTFSFAKDISMLALLFDEELRRLIQEEIKIMVENMQKYIQTRIYDNERKRIRIPAKAYITTYEHHTSRSLDPQLHYHNFICNQVITEDNQLLAIEPDNLIKHHHTLSIETNYRIMQKMQDKYAVFLDKTGDLRIIEDEELINKFSKRKEQIIQKAKELFKIDNLENLSREQIKMLVEFTRQKKIKTDINSIHELWLHELNEINYDKKKFINQAKQKAQLEDMTEYEIKQAFDLAILHTTRFEGISKKDHIYRNFLIKLSEVARQSNKKLIDIKKAQYYLDRFLENMIKIEDINKNEYYTTEEYMKTEQNTLHLAEKLANTEMNIFSKNEINEKIKEYEAKHFPLSRDQKEVFNVINRQLIIINGHAGTGKTTIAEILKSLADMKQVNTIGLSATGKATEELQKNFNNANTIDSFLLKIKNNHNYLNEIKNSIMLVDEASMMNLSQAKELLEIATKTNSLLILQGDIKQIKPVTSGDFYQDCYNLFKQKYQNAIIELTDIRRQKKQIYKEITTAYSNKDFEKAFDILIDNKDTFFDTIDIDKIKQDFLQQQNSLIVTYTNHIKEQLNLSIRKELKRQQKISQKSIKINTVNTYEIRSIHDLSKDDTIKIDKDTYQVISISHKSMKIMLTDIKTQQIKEVNFNDLLCKKAERHAEKEFSINDRIITTRNDKNVNVKNGEIFYIVGIDANNNLILQNDNKKIKINPNNYNFLDYSYCITIHKSQGTTIDNVLIVDQDNSLNGNLFYVAITRGRQNLKIYTNDIVKTLYNSQIEQKKNTSLSLRERKLTKMLTLNDIAERLILNDKNMLNRYKKYIDDYQKLLEKMNTDINTTIKELSKKKERIIDNLKNIQEDIREETQEEENKERIQTNTINTIDYF